ncbi:MAG: hypothetical protein V4501_06780 [Pseudomonadota bacterium]
MPNKINKYLPSLTKAFFLSLASFSCFYTQLAFADVPDAATMLQNLISQVPQFMQLVTATAYVMGIWFIYKGVLGLKAFGEQRNMMAQNEHLKGPLIMMAVGAALLYLPSSVQAGLTTFWGDSNFPNPYAYVPASNDDYTVLYQDAFILIQLLGTVAFIRGLLVLSALGGGGQGASLGKGMTYIGAGVMCINLPGFLDTINGTLGITGIITNGT